MELAIGREVDRYRVEGVLGRGGMATVYQVRHLQLDTHHALKVLELSSAQLQGRLLQEGRVQARLAHRNVVSVSDIVEVDGHQGLLMELIEGPTLDRVLWDGPLEVSLADELVPGILAGVAAAHANGVVHRDLKPANILLQVKGGLVVPKVADFGLVKAVLEQGRTQTGMTMGTPAYMAPEQIRNAREVDGRADVFALGAVLYEMVCGVRAFEGDSVFDIHQKILGEAWVRSPAFEQLPARMRHAIEGALRPDRTVRCASVEALWAAWSPDAPALEEAAARSIRATQRFIELVPHRPVGASAPSGGTWTASPEPAPALASGPDAGREPPRGDSGAAPPVAAASAGGSSVTRLAVGVASLALLGAAALLAQLRWAAPTSIPPIRVDGPPVPPIEATVGPVEPVPVPAPVVAPGPPPGPVPEDRVAPVRPVPAPPPAAPEPDPILSGRLEVMGDVAVRLKPSQGGTPLGPGDVPVGTYQLEGRFPVGWEAAGSVTIRAGETVRVSCNGGLRRCNLE